MNRLYSICLCYLSLCEVSVEKMIVYAPKLYEIIYAGSNN